MGRLIRLDSGKWYAEIVRDVARKEHLRLVCPSAPRMNMRVPLPFSWRQLDEEHISELARRPEVRLWLDEANILWRISEIGPDTDSPFPVEDRYLVFDSKQHWSGIVPFEAPPQLGDLTNAQLRAYRDAMSDFGGSREEYRPPDQA